MLLNRFRTRFNIVIILIIFIFQFEGNLCSQSELKSKYNMGVSASLLDGINLSDAQATLQFWIQYFVENYDEVTEAKIRIINNSEELISAVNNKEIDMAMITSISYVMDSDKLNLDPIIISKFSKEIYFSLLFCTNSKDNKKNFNDFKDKHIIVVGGKFRKISELWLDLLCLKNGIKDKDKFFKKIEFVEKPMQAVLPVFLNKADLCILNDVSFDSMKEMNPQISKSVEVIYKRDNLTNDITCVRSDLGNSIKDIILKRGLNHKSLPASDQVMKIFKAAGAVGYDPVYLEGVKSLYQDYKKLKAK